jgi:hypothetical protein
LLITSNNGPARLLRNDNGNQNDLLRVNLIGTRANHDGIGATVSVKTSKGAKQDLMVRTGSSYASQSELPLVFGLGKPEDGLMLTVDVTWPGGQRDSVSNVKPNQSIVIQEGKGVTSAAPIVFVTASAASPSPASSTASLH